MRKIFYSYQIFDEWYGPINFNCKNQLFIIKVNEDGSTRYMNSSKPCFVYFPEEAGNCLVVHCLLKDNIFKKVYNITKKEWYDEFK